MAILGRKVLLIAGLVCIVFAVLAWFLLYQPQIRRSQQSANQLERIEREMREIRVQIAQIEGLRARAAELEEESIVLEARIVPRAEMLSMFRQLARLAEQQRVQFKEISPPGLDTLLQAESPAQPVRGVPFDITLQGRYLDIGRYIENLDRFPYFVRIPGFEVTARQDIRPEVEMKLMLNLYTSSLAGD